MKEKMTIEAYSKSATLHGFEEASACGIIAPSAARFRVRDSLGVSSYKIDRLE